MANSCMQPTMHYKWSRSLAIAPKNHIISSDFAFTKPFKASYERENCIPNINYLLGWEYYRIWRRDVDQYLEKHKEKTKEKKLKRPKFNKPKPKEETKAGRFKIKKFEKVAGRTDHKGKDPKELRKNNTNKGHESTNNYSNGENNEMKNIAPYCIQEDIVSARSAAKNSSRSSCSTHSSTHSKQPEVPGSAKSNISNHEDACILTTNGCNCMFTDEHGNPLVTDNSGEHHSEQ